MTVSNSTSFRQLENLAVQLSDSSLDEWYARIRDIPVCALQIGDVCRALRQQLFIDAVVPVAICRLSENPMAGDKYDGELLAGMKEIPSRYWSAHPDEAHQVLEVVNILRGTEDHDIKADTIELMNALGLK